MVEIDHFQIQRKSMNNKEKLTMMSNDIDEIRKNIKTLQGGISDADKEIERLEREIDTFEIDIYDYEEEYRESLDEEGDVESGDMTYSKSEYMEMESPKEYKEGLRDYAYSIDIKDNEKYAELNADLMELKDDKRITEELIEDLVSELQELETEFATLQQASE